MDYSQVLNDIIAKERENVKKIGADFPYNDVDGKFAIVEPSAWTNGFYPGLLWICYLAEKNELLKNTAIEIEEKLDENIVNFTLPSHDVGFVWLLSSGIQYKINKNTESKRRLLQTANYLAGRFNIKGRYIRAWDSEDGNDIVPGLAIIDCMMNIPLLFWASEQTGDPRFSHIAKAHADTALKIFIDDDGAVRHICRLNQDTGEFIKAIGGQGYSENSAWSRGAAWAIYGFSMAYEYTKDNSYLDAACKVAKFFVSQLADDYVPAWDFRADSNHIKDASAGAIAASGMLEIYKLTHDEWYKKEAEKLIEGIVENCACFDNSRQAIVTKCTAYLPGNENIEVGLIYGDYYFAESVYKLANGNYDLLW